MNGQPIPGFYFDAEKQKYFKIQSAAASRDLNLRYSADNIRKRERIERLKDFTTARTSKLRKERVVRRHASNLTHTCIEREIGLKRKSFYMQGAWPNACISGVAEKPESVLELPAQYIRYFDLNPEDRTLFATHADNTIWRHYYDPEPWDRIPPGGCPDPLRLPSGYDRDAYSIELGRTTSPISSLCYFNTTGALTATTIGSDRPPVIYACNPEEDGPSVSQQFTPKDCPNITSAAARLNDDCTRLKKDTVAETGYDQLAVAASYSLILLTRDAGMDWNSKVALQNNSSPINSVGWLSYNTVALGCRNGKLLLYDTRSGGSSHILTHPSPINKIARADDPSRIICSGLANSLYLYDIRSTRSSSFKKGYPTNADTHYNETFFSTLDIGGPMRSKKRRKFDAANVLTCSQPLLTFKHSNMDNPHCDIAVHRRLGLVAAAQDDQTDVAIRVSNIYTGKIVREFKHDPSKRENADRRAPRWVIRSLKFVDSEWNDDVDLWTTWDGGVAKFTWASGEEKEDGNGFEMTQMVN
ncbi:hypothetical protein T440DRAFT_277652 [Plenodomus tracheiphilus IPT5]|uniref:WD40 repeat-like protein n=1 Tax=Plenodomus tracheiphilus IPT5 TaxID=1408161 RepID=A0A6A7AQ50_9PLEO|nr:hypothetical protein T440DRAFT_277652 [Plenodomus tracheiphilus IPT5]